MKPGESILTALGRELEEEGNIEIASTPVLHGLFHNVGASRRDHVAVYIVREFRQDTPPRPNYEIVAHGFFAPDALPDGTSKGTRAPARRNFRGRASQRHVVND